MSNCMICERETVIFQYVMITEAPADGHESRKLFCRFDQLMRVHEAIPQDFREPYTLRWNPGPKSDDLGLDEHRRLADQPRMRGLPDMVRAKVKRSQIRAKLSQFLQARERLLNP